MVGGLGNQLFQTAACLKYRNYRENLLVDRLNEMEKRTISINNRAMKFDLKFYVVSL